MATGRQKQWSILRGFFVLIVMLAALPTTSSGFEILIDVAPNVLNLQSNGTVVTVHADIGFDEVEVSSVYLNDVSINFWKEDDLGYFVAKFLMNDIKNLSLDVDAFNTFLFVGVTKSGQAFMGAQDIMVVNNIPEGKR